VAAQSAGGERRRFAGVTRKHVAGLGFECGLHWEIAGITGNRSRGSRGGGNNRRRRPAARGGSGSTARLHGRRKAWKRGKERPARILTTTEASGPLARRRGAAERWCGDCLKLGNGHGERAWVLGFLGRDAAAAAWGELGHRAGLYRAVAGALTCGPRAPRGAERWSGAWPDSDLGPSLARGEDGPDRWGPPISERKGRRREELARGERWAGGPAGPRGGEERKAAAGLSRGEKGGGLGQLGWAARWERKKRRKPVGLGCK
jgi:hypothetical protein